MSAKIFVDTNVLVYARDSSESCKQQLAVKWMEYLWKTHTGRLSFQVLQEYYVTVTHKLRPGLENQEARQDIRSLTAWKPVYIDTPVIENAWQIQDRFHLSWWDSLIVSAAQISECRYLLTEDLQDKQFLSDVTVLNPFNTSPDEI